VVVPATWCGESDIKKEERTTAPILGGQGAITNDAKKKKQPTNGIVLECPFGLSPGIACEGEVEHTATGPRGPPARGHYVAHRWGDLHGQNMSKMNSC